MTIEEWIVGKIKSTTAITNLIGGGAAARFYPEMAPQNAAYPHGTYQVIDFPQFRTLGGPSGLAYPRIQIDWWDNSSTGKKKVSQLVEATRQTLDGYFGTDGGLHVQSCQLDNREFSSEPAVNADEVPFRRGSMDFIVYFTEV